MNYLYKIETIANYWIKRHLEADKILTNGRLFDLCYLSKGYFLALRCTLLFDALMTAYLDEQEETCILYPDLGDTRAGEVTRLYRAPDILDVYENDSELDILNEIWESEGLDTLDYLLNSDNRPYIIHGPPYQMNTGVHNSGVEEGGLDNVKTALFFREVLFSQDHMEEVYDSEMRYQREVSDEKKVTEKLKAEIAVLRKKVEDQKDFLDLTGFG